MPWFAILQWSYAWRVKKTHTEYLYILIIVTKISLQKESGGNARHYGWNLDMENRSGNIVLAGGSGFIGTNLAAFLAEEGYNIIVLARNTVSTENKDHISFRHWDGRTMTGWEDALEGVVAVINLSGRNINCRLNKSNRQSILNSRVESTAVLAEAVRKCSIPPAVFIQASAVGYYGSSTAEKTEESQVGNGFLADVCRKTEHVLNECLPGNMRRVILRLGVVLGRDGGAFPILQKVTSLLLGGSLGTGTQYMSWIHTLDLNRIFVKAITDINMTGVYNAVSPDTVTNADFMKTLRAAMKKPWSPPVPSPAVRIGSFLIGSNSMILLEGQNAVPRRLLDMGFKFDYADLSSAFRELAENKQAFKEKTD